MRLSEIGTRVIAFVCVHCVCVQVHLSVCVCVCHQRHAQALKTEPNAAMKSGNQ